VNNLLSHHQIGWSKNIKKAPKLETKTSFKSKKIWDCDESIFLLTLQFFQEKSGNSKFDRKVKVRPKKVPT